MRIANDVRLGKDVLSPQPDLGSLHGCAVGDRVRVSPFVEMQKAVGVGGATKISSYEFTCRSGLGGVPIGQFAFTGAASVVTRDVVDYAIVACVPARQIGMAEEGKL